MRFILSTARLKEALDTVSRVTGVNPVTPILENVYIEARPESVRLVGTNLDITIDTIISENVEILETGSFTIGSKILSSYVSLLSDDRVEVSLNANAWMIVLESTSGETKIKGIDASKFPLPDANIVRNMHVSIANSALKNALEKTLFSTAKENVRPSLAGVYVRFDENSIAFASTDSYRLTEYKIPMSVAEDMSGKHTIIPDRSAHEVLKSLKDDKWETTLAIGDGSMSATVGNTVITSRLIQGKFPDYTNFFPKSFSTKVVASRSELIAGLRRIQLIARENKDNIRISFNHEIGIEISTGETQIGNGRTIVKASLEWNEERVGLNVVFLLEVLNVIREDFVSLDFETPLSPILVHGVPAATPESQAFRHIIMPLKI